jgi:ABC-type phosphate transport system ATPase subunit
MVLLLNEDSNSLNPNTTHRVQTLVHKRKHRTMVVMVAKVVGWAMVVMGKVVMVDRCHRLQCLDANYSANR